VIRRFMNHAVNKVCKNAIACSAYTLQTLFWMLANWGTVISQRVPCLSTDLEVYTPVKRLMS
jgi:hypothetical protein